jgi:hypothetical protein
VEIIDMLRGGILVSKHLRVGSVNLQALCNITLNGCVSIELSVGSVLAYLNEIGTGPERIVDPSFGAAQSFAPDDIVCGVGDQRHERGEPQSTLAECSLPRCHCSLFSGALRAHTEQI